MFGKRDKTEDSTFPPSEFPFITDHFESVGEKPQQLMTPPPMAERVESSTEVRESTISDYSGQPIVAPLYGEKTTFGSMPWWSNKDWWKIAGNGEGNDIRAHVGTVGDIAMAVASVRGHKHRLGAAANQDSYSTRTVTLDDGRSFLIVVLCDGMGSAPFSSFGARLFSHHMASIIALTIKMFPNDYIGTLNDNQAATLDYVSNKVLAYRLDEFDAPNVDHTKISVKDVQCTMTFAIVPAFPSPTATGERTATFGFIGDSPAFILRDREWCRVDENKDGSGIWSSATEGAINSTSMALIDVDLDPTSVVLLTSDGVGNFIRFNDLPTTLGRDLAVRWAQPVGMLEFVRDLSFETQSADDDRTAAVIWIDE